MEQNPYEAPREQQSPPLEQNDSEKLKRQSRYIAVAVLFASSIPASVIAFFTVCAATNAGRMTIPELIPCFVAAVIVGSIFICAAVVTWIVTRVRGRRSG